MTLMYMYLSGTVKVWDVRQDNDPVALMQPKETDTKRDCWAVAFGNLPWNRGNYHKLLLINIIILITFMREN